MMPSMLGSFRLGLFRRVVGILVVRGPVRASCRRRGRGSRRYLLKGRDVAVIVVRRSPSVMMAFTSRPAATAELDVRRLWARRLGRGVSIVYKKLVSKGGENSLWGFFPLSFMCDEEKRSHPGRQTHNNGYSWCSSHGYIVSPSPRLDGLLG